MKHLPLYVLKLSSDNGKQSEECVCAEYLHTMFQINSSPINADLKLCICQFSFLFSQEATTYINFPWLHTIKNLIILIVLNSFSNSTVDSTSTCSSTIVAFSFFLSNGITASVCLKVLNTYIYQIILEPLENSLPTVLL